MVEQHLFVCVLVLALALPIFFNPSDGAVVRRKLGHCQRKGEYKREIIACDGPCKIRRATARGNVDMVGRVGKRVFTPLLCGRKCFCRGFTKKPKWEKCKKKRGFKIRKQHVSFVLRCKKWSRNVRLTVIGNVKLATKRPTTREVMEIGEMAQNDQKFFIVECNGNCAPKYLRATFIGGNVDLFAGRTADTRFITWCGRRSNYCCGKKTSETNETCTMTKEVSSNSFYILVDAKKRTLNVKLHFMVGGFLSIKPYIPAVILRKDIGAMAIGEKKFFKVRCNGICEVQALHLSFVGNVYVTASSSSLRGDITDCSDHKCICLGKEDVVVNSQSCVLKNSASSNSFYIMLEARKTSTRIEIVHRIRLFSSMDPYTPAK